MTPYTPATVDLIRDAATQGKRRGEIRNDLGWDDGMLDRICQRHSIVFYNSSDAPQKPSSKTDNQVCSRSQSAGIHHDTHPNQVGLDRTSITICISPTSRARLESCGDQHLSGYCSMILHEANLAGFPNWHAYRGDQRVEYVTVVMSRDEKIRLTQAANKHGESLSSFCAAVLERHLEGVAQ
jgi:hypothetical protein